MDHSQSAYERFSNMTRAIATFNEALRASAGSDEEVISIFAPGQQNTKEEEKAAKTAIEEKRKSLAVREDLGEMMDKLTTQSKEVFANFAAHFTTNQQKIAVAQSAGIEFDQEVLQHAIEEGEVEPPSKKDWETVTAKSSVMMNVANPRVLLFIVHADELLAQLIENKHLADEYSPITAEDVAHLGGRFDAVHLPVVWVAGMHKLSEIWANLRKYVQEKEENKKKKRQQKKTQRAQIARTIAALEQEMNHSSSESESDDDDHHSAFQVANVKAAARSVACPPDNSSAVAANTMANARVVAGSDSKWTYNNAEAELQKTLIARERELAELKRQIKAMSVSANTNVAATKANVQETRARSVASGHGATTAASTQRMDAAAERRRKAALEVAEKILS